MGCERHVEVETKKRKCKIYKIKQIQFKGHRISYKIFHAMLAKATRAVEGTIPFESNSTY